MNRVDVVDLVVDLVDADLDVDLVDVDLDVDLVDVVSLSSSCFFIFWPLASRLYFHFLTPSCSGSIFALLYLGPPCSQQYYAELKLRAVLKNSEH